MSFEEFVRMSVLPAGILLLLILDSIAILLWHTLGPTTTSQVSHSKNLKEKMRVNVQTLITELSKVLEHRLAVDWKSAQLIKGLSSKFDSSNLPPDQAIEASLSWIDSYIWEHRKQLDPTTIAGLVDAFGSFLGECIIARCGRHWKETGQGPAIEEPQTLRRRQRRRALEVAPVLRH